MKELELKYGCNPNQKPASISMKNGGELPVEVLNGRPGYINFLDALNGYQLVKELSQALSTPAATSFKHVSPAGAAVGTPLTKTLADVCRVDGDYISLSPLACAYARARGADRMSSFGDYIALSHPCDIDTAKLIQHEISDGIIAPGYDEDALEILRSKKKGNYCILKIDPDYVPDEIETKQVFGITFTQGRNNIKITSELLTNIVTENKELPKEAVRDLITSLITLKYTQSNSVCFAMDGQAIGIGAGQQSRIHCTRLAAQKADNWWLRHCPKVLELPFKKGVSRPDMDNATDLYITEDYNDFLEDADWENLFTVKPSEFTQDEKSSWLAGLNGVSLGSDAFFPFYDNIERATKSGVKYVVQPGGSIRDQAVIDCANSKGIVMIMNQLRLFHH